MTLGVGEGIAILGICGTVITAMIKFVPRRNKNSPGHNPGNPGEYVRKDICDLQHKTLTEDITEIKGDVKLILTSFKIG